MKLLVENTNIMSSRKNNKISSVKLTSVMILIINEETNVMKIVKRKNKMK